MNDWLETPVVSGTDQNYKTHYLSGNSKERNWSFYWSPTDQVALWVAYPLNASLIGSGDRTNAWGYDPLLADNSQPNLSGTYKEYKADGSGYDRGHQIPSADRLNYAENVSTFYYTNMTPQHTRFNGGAWGTLEDDVRGWATANGTDMLYVVTGCVVSGSTRKAHDNDGKEVTIPTHYYKVLLRYRNGAYTACGFWFDHEDYPTVSQYKANRAGWRKSVDQIEALTGIDFFPNLIGVVGQAQADAIESNATAF